MPGIFSRTILLLGLVAGLSACGGAPSNVQAPDALGSFREKASLKVLWSRSAGSMTATGGRIHSIPHDDSIITVSSSGTVTSINKSTGKQNWTVNLDRQISAGVGGGDPAVLVATRDGDIVALSPDTGAVLWSINVAGEALTAPVYGAGKIFVQTVDGRVVALSARTGKSDWVYERTVPSLSLRGNSGPVYQQGLIVAGFASGHVVGIDARNGRAVWERVVAFPSGRSDVERLVDVDSPPIISANMLFAASYQGKLVAIDLRNGKTVWSRPLSVYLPMFSDGNRLYVVNDQGVVLAIDQNSGADKWIQGNLKYRISSGPVVASGSVVVGDFEGYNHLLSLDTGEIIGRRNIDNSKVVSNQVVDGRICTNTASGKVLVSTIEPL